jgi:superfamily II DNA or RNA helicase
LIANPEADIQIEDVNESFIRITTPKDESLFYELSEFFTFKIENAQFNPKVKARIWDGNIRLLNRTTGMLYKGLLPYIPKFGEDRGTTYSYNGIVEPGLSDEKLDSWMDSLMLHSPAAISDENPAGNITARGTQRFCVKTALKEKRAVFVSPTGTGKSLIAYLVARYLLDTKSVKKILLVVPTVPLVHQMFADFGDYSVYNEWDVDGNCHKIYQGQDNETDKKIVISTWQSIYSLPEEWFEQFDAVIGDEAHKWTAKCLRMIMEMAVNAKYRMAMTGTLSELKIHKLVLEGLFGKLYTPDTTTEIKSTKRAMDDGEIAQAKIVCIVLEYPESDRKFVTSNRDYQSEISFLIGHKGRNNFLKNLILSLDGNTLVLCRRIDKHLKILYNMIVAENKDPKRKIFLYYGDIDGTKRREIQQIVDTQKNAIILAGEAAGSTGDNIPSIENLVKASPTRSKVTNLQGIGRSLRKKGTTKTRATIYDVVDDLAYKGTRNYALEHFVERLYAYIEQKFKPKIHRIPIT